MCGPVAIASSETAGRHGARSYKADNYTDSRCLHVRMHLGGSDEDRTGDVLCQSTFPEHRVPSTRNRMTIIIGSADCGRLLRVSQRHQRAGHGSQAFIWRAGNDVGYRLSGPIWAAMAAAEPVFNLSRVCKIGLSGFAIKHC